MRIDERDEYGAAELGPASAETGGVRVDQIAALTDASARSLHARLTAPRSVRHV